MDFKFNTFKHPMFKRSGDGKGKWYVHNPQDKKKLDIIEKGSGGGRECHHHHHKCGRTGKAWEYASRKAGVTGEIRNDSIFRIKGKPAQRNSGNKSN